jgi:hypothetical protein
MKFYYTIICFVFLSKIVFTQDDTMLKKLDKNDSLSSIKTRELSDKSVVSHEIHNVLFRNIYRSQSNNEEAEFKREIARLMPYDNKKIDAIIYRQVNAFGESVYDSTIKSNRFESILSKNIHVNTQQEIIKNRYQILKEGDVFSPYLAFENARLIRSSGIFHDVRIEPIKVENDSNHIILIYHLQDVFPYGFSLGVNSPNDISFGIENVNIFGLTHRLSTDYRINTKDPNQVFGLGLKYTIPNIIKKSFIDAYTQHRNFSGFINYEIGIYRQFVRPDIRWAGGNILAFNDRLDRLNNNNLIKIKQIENQLWLSYAFPFRSRNTTINSIITGVSYRFRNNIDRPSTVSVTEFDSYWNSHFVLSSIGYSKIKYVQERIINGFGRTEDIPTGISINGLFGIDYNEFNIRNYYGGQVLVQYYTGAGYYVNMSTKLGFFSRDNSANQGVFDFNLQNVSKAYKLGSFRLRNYVNLRTTIGINHDSARYITLNDYNGIRGANNGSFKGNSRFTMSAQSNLFLPFTLGGFRFSIFGLFELAKIQPSFNNFFETPLKSGFSMGVAIKNENLIFDVIQLQYGFYPSTSSLMDRGFVISSIIPFRFQSLDISKPNTVSYE